MDTLELIPAYGRDYTSQKAVREAWFRGDDFQIASYGPDMGRYISYSDSEGTSVLIRYAKLQKVVSVKSLI